MVNSPITVTAVVAVMPPGAGSPSEAFTATDGSAICVIPTSGASCNLTPTTAGPKTLTASYPGNLVTFNGSVSPGVSHTVTGGGSTPTATVVTVVNPQGSGNTTSTATSVFGQPVAVTFTVTAASGAAAPDGSASVYVDGISSCTAMLGSPVGLTSTGTCSVTSVGPGPVAHVISTSYTGTATFAASASSGPGNGSLTVNRASTTTTITAHTPDPSVVNSPIVVTAVVAVVPPGVGSPTEAFTATDGTAVCVIPTSGASCNLTPTTAGPKTLTASYPGNLVSFNGSVSPGVSHTVTGGGTTFIGPTVAPGVTGTVTLSGGGPSCVLVNPAFIAAPLSPPPGTSFPFGLFDFSTAGCTIGGTITVQIVYSQPLPAGTQYWKFGPTPGNAPHWYVMPGATVVGTTVNFAIEDGQVGDDDLTANGGIVDQGGPGVPTVGIPTSNSPGLALLALILAGLGLVALRRRVV